MANSSLFWRQFIALMKRNVYLKKRNKNSTIQEFLMPIYFVALLGVIRMSISPRQEPEIEKFPENELTTTSYIPYSHLFVSPDTSFTRDFTRNLSAELPTTFNVTAVFSSGEALEEFYRDNSSAHTSYVIGIQFTDVSPEAVNYTLRFSSVSVPATDDLYGSQGSCRQLDGLGHCGANFYLSSGFARLQTVIDTLLIRYFKNDWSYPEPEIYIQQMPKSDWLSTTTTFQIFSSIYFVIAYSTFVTFILIAIVTEKEKKIKDGMRLMGLRTSALWLSWGVTYAIIIGVVTLLITILAAVIKLYHHSNMVYVFLLLMLYGLSIITMSFMLTPFFHKAELAGTLASLATTLFSFSYLAIALTRYNHMGPQGPISKVPTWAQWLLCLFSPIALALGIDQSLYLDISEGGMQTENLWYGQFPVAGSLIMLLVDVILYGVLALYFDNVIPDEYGRKLSPFYCLRPTFWCPQPSTEAEMSSLITTLPTVTDANTTGQTQPDMEPIAKELADKNVIRICKIKKSFSTKKKKVPTATLR